MRQNLISAGLQASSSLVIALLTIGIFRLLSPEQMAFLRQHYFVPFALIASISPANQNYLRSVLFSQQDAEGKRGEARSLSLVQSATGLLLLVGIILAIGLAGSPVSPLNTLALTLALVMILVRTLVTGVLEARGRYSPSILLNNYSTVTPYIAALIVAVSADMDVFFISAIALSLATTALIAIIGRRIQLSAAIPLNFRLSGFRFDFKRYFSLAMISIGSVVVYQGVEFCLYNYTSYSEVEVANYSLAFTACNVMRQIFITAVQPFENEKTYYSTVKVFNISFQMTTLLESMLYMTLICFIIVSPYLIEIFFPKYNVAGSFIVALTLGVLGSAVQQIYTVRLVASARTKFLSQSQSVLAVASILAVLLLCDWLSLQHLVWTLAALIWLRGCIVVPAYIARTHGHQSLGLWFSRLAMAAIIFSSAFWR